MPLKWWWDWSIMPFIFLCNDNFLVTSFDWISCFQAASHYRTERSHMYKTRCHFSEVFLTVACLAFLWFPSNLKRNQRCRTDTRLNSHTRSCHWWQKKNAWKMPQSMWGIEASSFPKCEGSPVCPLLNYKFRLEQKSWQRLPGEHLNCQLSLICII